MFIKQKIGLCKVGKVTNTIIPLEWFKKAGKQTTVWMTGQGDTKSFFKSVT